MADYLTNTTDLTAVADSIRAKTGGTNQLEWPDEYVSEIGTLSKGRTEVLLWENPSPSSQSQGWTLTELTAEVLRNYDEIAIEYKDNVGDAAATTKIYKKIAVFVPEIPTGSVGAFLLGAPPNSTAGGMYGRNVLFSSTNRCVVIGRATALGSGGSTPDVAIPLKIYGVV